MTDGQETDAKRSNERAYRVYRLATGVVIDHIPARKALKVVEVLGLSAPGDSILAVGINLESRKLGRKDVIKIEGADPEDLDYHKIALVAPGATINILKDHLILKKFKVEVPEDIRGLLVCPTSNCITNHEPVESRFHYAHRRLTCHFCERRYALDGVRMKA